MKRVLLLLAAALPALGQSLPFAWSDQPQGTLLYLSMPFQFMGASAPGLPGEVIVAWSDMRDGQGRVMLQKVSSLHPEHPGRWQSELPGWGPVEAWAGPVCTGAPFQPWLASDGEGGAIVLWQDANSAFGSTLRALRVGDGAGGVGQPLWPADLLIADDVPVPEEGCRDFSARCRSIDDPNKAICGDGSGGAWVVWRNVENALFAQHLTAAGVLDPDFPADGLNLPCSPTSFRLVPDNAGNAQMIYSSYDETMDRQHVHALGIRADGGLLHPEPDQVTPDADYAYRFDCQAAGGGRTLVAWLNYGTWEVKAQLLDADLQPIWTQDGVFLQLANEGYNVLCAAAGPQGPFFVAHDTNQQWLAHKLDAQGHEVWASPARLDMFDNDDPDVVVALELCGSQLNYLLWQYPAGHLQRLTDEGVQAWPVAQTRLNSQTRGGYFWTLDSDAQDGAFAAWLEADNVYQQIRVQHRDTTGQDLFDAPASELARQSCAVGGWPFLLAAGDDALAAWTCGDSLFTQSVQGHTGSRGWAFEGRGLGQTPWAIPASAPSGDGAWLLAYVAREGDGSPFLRIQHVDREGQALLPWQDVVPGSAATPDFYGHERALLVINGDRVYVLFEELTALRTLKCQAFTLAGERLWGEDGVTVASFPSWTYLLNQAAAAADGGLDLTWTVYEDGQSRGYLQHLTHDGDVAYQDNAGRGRLVDVPLNLYCRNLDLLALPDGSRVFWAVTNDASLNLLAHSADGQVQWARHVDDVYVTAARLTLDEDGTLLLGWSHSDFATSSFTLQRLLPTGTLDMEWHSPAAPYNYPEKWCLVQGREQTALVAASGRPNYLPGTQLRGYLLVEGEEVMQTLFDAPLAAALNYTQPTSLSPAPEGDVWLTWQEDRGTYSGYGMQARLTRLDVLDLNTTIAEPARPAALRLAQNRPNPFNPDTWIVIELAQAGPARLEIYNLAGQRVRLLQDGELTAGHHRLHFDALDDAGRPLASGLYLYRLSAGGGSRTERMLLVR